jgi:enoyl-CoA hydratase/carnithine racemase
MAYRYIKEDVVEKTYVITINRPEADNKLNIECMDEISASLKKAESDPGCRSVILTNSGRFFCSGGELGDFRCKSSMEIRKFGESFINMHMTICSINKPVIAAVKGHALGGGMNLVEACDLAVAGESVQFGVPEMKSGLAPMMALTGVKNVLSRKGVMELSLFGDCITAKRALEIGLVNRICEKQDDVMDEALKMARAIAKSNPVAVSLCKGLYQKTGNAQYRQNLESGLDLLISLLKSEDAAEALTAAEENRIPVWKDR